MDGAAGDGSRRLRAGGGGWARDVAPFGSRLPRAGFSVGSGDPAGGEAARISSMGSTADREVRVAGRAEAAFEAVLASPGFQRAPALRRLLEYLWKHRAEAPGEYALALDVFGKRAEFDPKLDATVRVHVARLRQKLKEYFEAEGQDQPVRLTIPAGRLRLEVLESEPPPAASLAAPGAAAGGTRGRPLVVALVLACAALSGAVVWLWRENRRMGRDVARLSSSGELPVFWRRALGNHKLTRMVFPTPVFFRLGDLSVRDATINDPADFTRSPKLRAIAPGLVNPTLSQSYSVTSDTLAMATLTRLLANGGVPLAVGATQDLSLELFGSDNLIFLGIPHTSQHVERILSRTDFYLRPRGQRVCVRHPLPGEPATFADSHGMRFGIVAVLPGQAPGTRLILLSGTHTAALASYLASPITLRQLEEYLRQRGQPEYFEMVVSAEVDGYKLRKGHPVAFRNIPASLWK